MIERRGRRVEKRRGKTFPFPFKLNWGKSSNKFIVSRRTSSTIFPNKPKLSRCFKILCCLFHSSGVYISFRYLSPRAVWWRWRTWAFEETSEKIEEILDFKLFIWLLLCCCCEEFSKVRLEIQWKEALRGFCWRAIDKILFHWPSPITRKTREKMDRLPMQLEIVQGFNSYKKITLNSISPQFCYFCAFSRHTS
jgi:hypothetical protein